LFLSQQVQQAKGHHHTCPAFEKAWYRCIACGDDAGVLVVQTAVASAERHNTVLVGDDTSSLFFSVQDKRTQNMTSTFDQNPSQTPKEYLDAGTLRTFGELLQITSVTTFCLHMP